MKAWGLVFASLLTATAAAEQPKVGAPIRDNCTECPELVVLPGKVALGRHEVTVGQYRAFVAATDRADEPCTGGGSWRRPPYPIDFQQTDRHPVSCVSWNDAREYAAWLSAHTDKVYRLPTDEEWELGLEQEQEQATESIRCYEAHTRREGPCTTDVEWQGLLDMLGNLWEWTDECSGDECNVRGGAWNRDLDFLQTKPSGRFSRDDRSVYRSFRVLKELD